MRPQETGRRAPRLLFPLGLVISAKAGAYPIAPRPQRAPTAVPSPAAFAALCKGLYRERGQCPLGEGDRAALRCAIDMAIRLGSANCKGRCHIADDDGESDGAPCGAARGGRLLTPSLSHMRRPAQAIDRPSSVVLRCRRRRSVAQSGRAAVSKTAGRGFESFHSCHSLPAEAARRRRECGRDRIVRAGRAGGGIGRHAVLRGQWEKSRKSSNLFLRTNLVIAPSAAPSPAALRRPLPS